MAKQFSDGDGGAHSDAEIARLRAAMEEAVEFLSSPAEVTKDQRIANASLSLIEALAE